MVEAGPLHELIQSLQGTGNQVRLRLIEALRTLHDERLYIELGYSSFHQYCDRELGLGKSTAYEYVRVCTALDALPRLRAVFGQGQLSWDQTRQIARVATTDSEVDWIELAWQAPVRELIAETRDAHRAGRSAPREKRHGLPNLITRLSIDLSLEEKERVRAAFSRVAEALHASGMSDSQDDPRPTLLRWADGVLSGAIPVAPQAAADSLRPTPAQTILYHSCPECRSASVATEDGRVHVEPDRIRELAPHANRVHIDPREELSVEPLPAGETDAPNTQRLARQVLSRDGLRCQNPGCCSQRNLHAHHIVYRSRGGATALANEVTVCDRCHALFMRVSSTCTAASMPASSGVHGRRLRLPRCAAPRPLADGCSSSATCPRPRVCRQIEPAPSLRPQTRLHAFVSWQAAW